jgi:hypothetical protein
MAKLANQPGPVRTRSALRMWRAVQLKRREMVRHGVNVRLSEGTVMGGQRQSSSIRQQREMSRKLKAAEKRAKRQSRTTEKPKVGTEGARDR